MLGCPKGIFSQKEKPYTARTCREQIENRDNEFVLNDNSDEELIESSPTAIARIASNRVWLTFLRSGPAVTTLTLVDL